MNAVFEKITALTRAYDGAEILEEIFGEYHSAALAGARPVVLFCAGATGEILCTFFRRYGIDPLGFCDNNPARSGSNFCDLPVMSFEELKKEHQQSLIVIASTAFQRFVERQLLDNGFKAEQILSLDTKKTSFDQILKRERVLMLARNGEPGDLLREMQNDEDKLLGAYNLFEDQKSKDLFVRRLALIASGFDFHSYKSYLTEFSEPCQKYGYDNPARLRAGGSYFYFSNDVLRLDQGEVFVDGGAYTGDSTDEFVAACEKQQMQFNAVFCFEADGGNFKKLLEHTSGYRRVTCRNLGLWSHSATVRFLSSAKTEAYGARIQEEESATPGTADMEINTTSIDEQFKGRKITLIKMDIEGAELEAVQGAADSLKRHAPKLAISVYHKIEDLYEIPLLVHRIQPGYKLYLRHLGNYFDDTVLFATMKA